MSLFPSHVDESRRELAALDEWALISRDDTGRLSGLSSHTWLTAPGRGKSCAWRVAWREASREW